MILREIKEKKKTRRQQNSPVEIRVRKPPKRRLDWSGLSVETTKKPEAPGHRRCGTMNTPHVSMANVLSPKFHSDGDVE